jgi:hypothetical protein
MPGGNAGVIKHQVAIRGAPYDEFHARQL